MLDRSLVVYTHFFQLLKNPRAFSLWPTHRLPLPRDYTLPTSFGLSLKTTSLLPSASPGLSPKTVLIKWSFVCPLLCPYNHNVSSHGKVPGTEEGLNKYLFTIE